MLITRVDGKRNSVRWVTEDGYVFKLKRKLQNMLQVAMVCQEKNCAALSIIELDMPYEAHPDSGKVICVKKGHSAGIKHKQEQYVGTMELEWNLEWNNVRWVKNM